MSILCAKLHNGVLLPAVSLGTYKLEDDDPVTTTAVHTALTLGYRGVDTAFCYKNEKTVGAAVRSWDGKTRPQRKVEPVAHFQTVNTTEFLENFAIPHGKPKDDRKTFITSKVWMDHLTPEGARAQLDEHLGKMEREMADMFILHWPGPHSEMDAKFEEGMKDKTNPQKRLAVWREMEKMYAEGKIRAIGVSNYMIQHLTPLLEDIKARKDAGDKLATIPMFNQFEISPYLDVPKDLLKVCKDNKIQIGSYSTLGSARGVEMMMNEPVLTQIAEKYKKPVSAIILRWALESGYSILPKSANPGRLEANFDLFDFELTKTEIKDIDKMERGVRFCPDPNLIA